MFYWSFYQSTAVEGSFKRKWKIFDFHCSLIVIKDQISADVYKWGEISIKDKNSFYYKLLNCIYITLWYKRYQSQFLILILLFVYLSWSNIQKYVCSCQNAIWKDHYTDVDIMTHIKIGHQVKLAQFEHYIFTVTATHQDGSFSIETTLDGQQILSYQNVAQEMLRPVML